MKNKYPIQVLGLRFQVDHNIPKKIQLIEEYGSATNITTFFIYYLDIGKLKWFLMEIKLLKLLLFEMTKLNLKIL